MQKMRKQETIAEVPSSDSEQNLSLAAAGEQSSERSSSENAYQTDVRQTTDAKMDLAKRFSKVQLPGGKASASRLTGAMMDEIFAKQQSYTPVAYINSPKRVGRKTVAFTESKSKGRLSLPAKPSEEQVLKQQRAAASLIVSTFGGPPNAKTNETDIR